MSRFARHMPEAAPVTSATLFSRQVHSEFLSHRQDANSLAVLFVADLLHPIYDLTLKTFLNADMGQSGPGRASLT